MRVRLYSHVTFATGYGRAGRELAMSLLAAGVELEIFPLGIPPKNLEHIWGAEAQDICGRLKTKALTTADVVIVHTLPVDCARVLDHLKLEKGQGPRLIVYTTWEAWSTPPKVLLDAWARFDELWMPATTQWHHPDILTRAVPHSFDAELHGEMRFGRKRASDTFRFYYLGAWDARKQPAALIRTFAYAFTPADDVELVLHTVGMDRMNFHVQVATTGLAQSELPKIRLSNEYLTDDQIAQFHADGDCFVTATRWEAWNLPAFDAMLTGRHIIATQYMGSDDFLVSTSATLVGSQLSPCAADVTASRGAAADELHMNIQTPQGLSSRAVWREPDLAAIASYMRLAFEHRTRVLKIPPAHYEGFERTTVGKHALHYLENP